VLPVDQGNMNRPFRAVRGRDLAHIKQIDELSLDRFHRRRPE
jgi:hypothetical protein